MVLLLMRQIACFHLAGQACDTHAHSASASTVTRLFSTAVGLHAAQQPHHSVWHLHSRPGRKGVHQPGAREGQLRQLQVSGHLLARHDWGRWGLQCMRPCV